MCLIKTPSVENFCRFWYSCHVIKLLGLRPSSGAARSLILVLRSIYTVCRSVHRRRVSVLPSGMIHLYMLNTHIVIMLFFLLHSRQDAKWLPKVRFRATLHHVFLLPSLLDYRYEILTFENVHPRDMRNSWF